MALGMAQQLQEPVVLICTSGTAALNFYPAIAEAYYQKIPLLVLTADRPPELLNQQDGQMIMQHNVYGKHVLGSFDLPCYAHGKENLQETANIVAKALEISNGEEKGPVHINVPLSEPLYPNKKEEQLNKLNALHIHTKTYSEKPVTVLTSRQKNAWQQSKKKLILVGQLPVNNALFTVLFELKKQQDIVIVCDVLSNKQTVSTALHADFIVSHSNEKVLKELEPDMIISFGGPVLSKSMKLWLKKQKPKNHFRIQQQEDLVNTYGNVTDFIKGDFVETLNVLNEVTNKFEEAKSNYQKQWETLEEKALISIKKFIDKAGFSELQATNYILQNLPHACNLQIANSSIIRYVSSLGNLNASWEINGNRGTSGIDGCTSTAVGAALINNRQTVLLTGDVGFLYDRNALWNKYVPKNLRVIVLNNYGGGIFSLIDGPSKHKEQLSYFTTPHKSSIKNTVLDNDLDYYFCQTEKELKSILKKFLEPGKKAAVLEISLDMKSSSEVFSKFKKIKL